MEVEEKHWGQDDHCDGSLEQFKPGHGSEVLNVRQPVNQSVFLCGQVRVPDQACDCRYKGSMEARLDWCVTR